MSHVEGGGREGYAKKEPYYSVYNSVIKLYTKNGLNKIKHLRIRGNLIFLDVRRSDIRTENFGPWCVGRPSENRGGILMFALFVLRRRAAGFGRLLGGSVAVVFDVETIFGDRMRSTDPKNKK